MSAPVTKLLADLVAIPSMNPMGRNRSGGHYSEQNIADFVCSRLRKANIDVEMYETAPGRPNVSAYVDTGSPETLLLEAHLDTVHADGMTIEPFAPVVKNGRLFGRGACDTKGSIASFLEAVVSTLTRKSMRYNVALLFVSDEEYCFTGAKAAAARGLKATFGIAGEPTGLKIVRAHKGVTRWNIRARGEAAHSAYPERGTNAIYRMAEVVRRVETYARDLTREQAHPLLGRPTISVGVIEGGQAVNVVPDACRIEIDRRSLPGESGEGIVEGLSGIVGGLAGIDVEQPYLSVAGMEVAESAPIVVRLSEALRKTKHPVHIEGAPYATDAGIYNASGIPTVVFGPGDIAQAHTANEYISIQDLEDSVTVLSEFISA
jgi:acetylornithine deacetylase